MQTHIHRLLCWPICLLVLTTLLANYSAAQTPLEPQAPESSQAEALATDVDQDMVELAIDIRETQKHLIETAGLSPAACTRWISQQALAAWSDATPLKLIDNNQQIEGPWFKVSASQLIVRGPRPAVGQLSKLFSELFASGLPVVRTQLKTLKSSEAAIESLGVRWSLIELESQLGDQANSADGSNVLPASAVNVDSTEDQQVTLAGLYSNRHTPGLAEALDNQLTTALKPAGAVPHATTTTELGTAMLYSILAPDEYAAIAQRMQDDERFRSGTHGEARNFAGLPVQLIDMTQRPLVTGVKSRVVDSGTDGQTKVIVLPQSRVYSVGHRFVLRPSLKSDSQLELAYRADIKDLHRIREVETNLSVQEHVKSVRVQVPTASHHQVAGKVAVPAGYTLAIWVSGDEAHNQPAGASPSGHSTLLLCTCNIVDSRR